MLFCQLALSMKIQPKALITRDISQTLYSNLEFFAQYAGSSYCTEDEDSAVDALITCGNDVCPLVEAAGAYNIVEFDGNDTDQEGYIAIDPKNSLIVVSFRGSSSILNFIDDADFPYTACEFGTGCEAHAGFYASWTSTKAVVVSTVTAAVEQFPTYQLITTGHSLGGAVATLAGAYLRLQGYSVDIYTYGSPRVFNKIGADFVTAQAGGDYRVTHFDDPVPRLPPLLIGYRHTSPEYWLSGGNATTNTYPISSIEICTGDANVTCNAQYDDFDVNAHLHYFEYISNCDGDGSDDSELIRATNQTNAEQKSMFAKMDISYSQGLVDGAAS